MGNWRITVEGTGIHHNVNQPGDANVMFGKFVNELKDRSHTIHLAKFEVLAGQTDYAPTYPSWLNTIADKLRNGINKLPSPDSAPGDKSPKAFLSEWLEHLEHFLGISSIVLRDSGTDQPRTTFHHPV